MSAFKFLPKVIALTAVMAVFMLGPACGESKHTQRDDTATATPEKSKVKASASDASQVEEVLVNPADVTIDETAGTATYAPNARMKRASYTRWVFDLASYRRAFDTASTKPATVKAKVHSRSKKVHKPGPVASSPDGGIETTIVKATILAGS